MQEPLSMLSKIMGEDVSSGSPREQQSGTDPPISMGSAGVDLSSPKSEESRDTRDGSPLSTCSMPCSGQKDASLNPSKSSESPKASSEMSSAKGHYEICTFGDIMQVVEIHGGGRRQHQAQPSKPPGRRPSSNPSRWLISVGLLAYAFFVLPLPSYLTGLSLGLACGFMMGLLVVLLLAPRHSPHPQKAPASPDDSLQSESLSKTPEVLQGWMNEMHNYDPETYHPSLTHSAFVTLEGSRLRLAYPRNNIPRQATFNEPAHEAVFIRSRSVDLASSKVSLLPPVLARKRIWNKKYPICIVLADGGEDEERGWEDAVEEMEDKDKQTIVDSDSSQSTTLYLFGRTGREKEEWFHHFLSASKAEAQGKLSRDASKTEVCSGGGSSHGSTEELATMLGLKELAGSVREKILLDYNSYMARFVASDDSSPTPSPCHSSSGSPETRKKLSSESPVDPGDGQPAWINALVGRIFWDFLREKYWADQVAHKIQKKLSKIRLPYFMNELTLADLDMGTCMPQVLSTSRPTVNHRGLWLELEVVYTGSLQMTLETKMNLCKLGRESLSETGAMPETSSVRPRVCVLADSDEESSSAGSSDEEEVLPAEPQGSLPDKGTPPGAEGHASGSTGRKILRFVDKIAKSKYFQKATENEYIKKKIAEVSNTPLLLTVEVLELSGTLVINIPPPPTDRIWYSFQVPPRLDLRVRPMLGEREVTFTHVTEWIERKLQCEFQKVLVMPNMDDLYLPLMSSGLDVPLPPDDCPDVSCAESQEREDSCSSEFE